MEGPVSGSTVALVFTTAQRSDGAQMRRQEMIGPDGKIRSSERTIELTDGTVASFDAISSLRTTTYDSTRKWRNGIRSTSSGCVKSAAGTTMNAKEVVVGKDLVDRYEVIKISHSGNHIWVAPSLGCAVLRAQYGPNLRVAETIVGGEPSAEPFAVPVTYREVPPSQFFRLPPGKAASDRDAFYHSHRPR